VFALDFNRYAPTAAPLCPAQLSPCTRDSRTNSDELVFYARNPNYWIPSDTNTACGGTACPPAGNVWRVSGATATSVTVSARAGDHFERGQVVVVVCTGGNFYAFSTVATNVPPLGVANPVLPVTLTPDVAGDPFNQPSAMVAAAAKGCFTSGSARMFLVDRYRFHIRLETVAGSFVPYLVLDRGIDANRDGTINDDDELVVAEGIENLQVGYFLSNGAQVGITGPLSTASGGTGSTGVADQITLAAFPGGAPPSGESVYVPSSFYGYTFGPPVPAQRLTDHQANIRAVRLALVARSPGTDREALGDTFLPFNMTSEAPWVTGARVNGRDGYQRALYESTVQLPNMISGGMTYY
jgi:type IV pilus assembly protein PilW